MSAPVTRSTDTSPPTNAPVDEGVKLATLARGADVELRIRAKAFKGHHFIDVREWSRRSAEQDWWPVKGRGVTIKLRELAEVITALETARTPTRDV
jgi:hypothetical protein